MFVGDTLQISQAQRSHLCKMGWRKFCSAGRAATYRKSMVCRCEVWEARRGGCTRRGFWATQRVSVHHCPLAEQKRLEQGKSWANTCSFPLGLQIVLGGKPPQGDEVMELVLPPTPLHTAQAGGRQTGAGKEISALTKASPRRPQLWMAIWQKLRSASRFKIRTAEGLDFDLKIFI